MITPKLQQATVHRRSGHGLYDPTYKSETIPCRIDYVAKLIQIPGGADRGKEFMSTAVIRTDREVAVGDLIQIGSLDPMPVQQVRAITGIGGEVLEYEVVI